MTLTTFDDDIEAAWRRFRIDLGDRIALLERGDEIRFGQFGDDTDTPPTMTLSVTSGRRYRCRLLCGAHHGLRRRAEHHPALDGDGWRQLRGGDFIVETGRRRIDRLAALGTQALRDVCDIIHPDFLTEDTVVQGDSVPTERIIEFAVMPQAAEELHQLAVDALAAMTGTSVRVDDDGMIPLPTHPTESWLRTLPDAAAMECFTVLCDRVDDPGGVALFLATNAHRWPGMSLRLQRGSVFASMRIECSVFHPANLATLLGMWFAFLREHAYDIEFRLQPLGSRINRLRAGTHAPPGLGGVLDLLHDGADADPSVIAAMCGNDSPRLVMFLRVCARHARRCRAAETDALERGATTEAARLDADRQQWWHVIRGLGAALNVVTEQRRQSRNAELKRPQRPA